jgi:hypothetical protein
MSTTNLRPAATRDERLERYAVLSALDELFLSLAHP